MPLNSDTKSRKDYLKDEFSHFIDDPGDSGIIDERLAQEDEQIWAWYRDPQTDLTQIEARDRAQSWNYGERYNLSQSGVSKKLRNMDDEMLTEPVLTLNIDEPLYRYRGYRQLEKEYPEYTDCLRTWLAKTICDWLALREIEPSVYDDQPDHQPEDWATSRVSELGYVPNSLF